MLSSATRIAIDVVVCCSRCEICCRLLLELQDALLSASRSARGCVVVCFSKSLVGIDVMMCRLLPRCLEYPPLPPLPLPSNLLMCRQLLPPVLSESVTLFDQTEIADDNSCRIILEAGDTLNQYSGPRKPPPCTRQVGQTLDLENTA